MPVIVCHVTADTGSDQYLLDLRTNWRRLQQEDVDTDLILVSGENRVRVHQAVLLPLSKFLQDLVPVCCPCTAPALTLPPFQRNTISALVDIIYTGRSNVVSQSVKEEFEELLTNLQLTVKVTHEKIASLVSEDHKIDMDLSPEKIMSSSELEEIIMPKVQLEKTTESIMPVDQPEKIIESLVPMVQHSVVSKAVSLSQRLTPILAPDKSKIQKKNSSNVSIVDSNENYPPTRKMNQPRKAKSDALVITTRGNKRKTEMECNSNENDINDMLPKRKKRKLDLGLLPELLQSEKANKLINIQDIITDDATASTEDNVNYNKKEDSHLNQVQHIFSETYQGTKELLKKENPKENAKIMKMKGDDFKCLDRKEPTNKENLEETKEDPTKRYKVDALSCPFCKMKNIESKSYYDGHLSWVHFKDDIIEKFPGLVCQICYKTSTKKSDHVKHIGVDHKIIDSLMGAGYLNQMAQIEQQKRNKGTNGFLHD